jgi:hypothetical protein
VPQEVFPVTLLARRKRIDGKGLYAWREVLQNTHIAAIAQEPDKRYFVLVGHGDRRLLSHG